MLLDVGMAVGGLIVLILAADRLVVAAIRLSRAIGVSAVLIGAVVVGFGTSVPEFVVSAIAAARGELEVAMGNVVASNTANVTLVLGAAAVVAVLAARASVVRREGYLMIAAVLLLSLVLLGGTVARWEGAVLLGLLGVALVLLVVWARRPGSIVVLRDDPAEEEAAPPVWANVAIAVVALAAVILAAQLLLEGLISIGGRLGWSAVFLGLITGVGTSLPELAAAVAAARKRESDLILGNVLGSNIFNSLGVAGLAAVIGPGVVAGFGPLLIVMVAACLVAGSFALTGQRLVRWEGLALLAAFGAYAVLSF